MHRPHCKGCSTKGCSPPKPHPQARWMRSSGFVRTPSTSWNKSPTWSLARPEEAHVLRKRLLHKVDLVGTLALIGRDGGRSGVAQLADLSCVARPGGEVVRLAPVPFCLSVGQPVPARVRRRIPGHLCHAVANLIPWSTTSLPSATEPLWLATANRPLPLERITVGCFICLMSLTTTKVRLPTPRPRSTALDDQVLRQLAEW